MTSKKDRMSMLDSLAAAGAPVQPSGMMPGNRALRAARDAVDSHKVWELDPAQIVSNTRISDRLDPEDVLDLRDAIEQNGQTVPILVRRDPGNPERYLLVYGARRLEAIRQSDKVETVRALVAAMDDRDATRAQISENMARRDLSFIEKALFARELIDSGFGTQTQVAEVLTVTKSSVSMALSIVEMVTPDLIRAIGPAHGVGRPRWEALGKAIEARGGVDDALIDLAERARADADALPALQEVPPDFDPSVTTFDAVLAAVPPAKVPVPAPAKPKPKAARPIVVDGQTAASLKRTGQGLRLDIVDGGFADWLEAEAGPVLSELYARWKDRV